MEDLLDSGISDFHMNNFRRIWERTDVQLCISPNCGRLYHTNRKKRTLNGWKTYHIVFIIHLYFTIQCLHDKVSNCWKSFAIILVTKHNKALIQYLPVLRYVPNFSCENIIRTVWMYPVISVPLLNMTSAVPLSVVLSLLSQRKEGKRGRSVSHV